MAFCDPRLVRDCLHSLPGVVDAHVWTKNDVLIGRVAVMSTSSWTGRDLQTACSERLGPHGAPRLLMLSLVEPRFAAA